MADQAQGLRALVEKIGSGRQARTNPTGPRVVAVTSGKGGVGKTNLAVNLALALHAQGKRVLVFDADFGLANVDVVLGVMPKWNLGHVIRHQKNFSDILFQHQGIHLISGGSGIQELLDLQQYQLERFLEGLGQLEKEHDIVLLDTGAGISRQVLGFVLAAQDILLVTTPEPTSITDAYALLKVIASRNKNAQVKLVVNKAVNVQEAKQVVGKLSLVSREFLSLEISQLGYILEDQVIPQAVKKQEPFLLAYPGSQASACIRRLAAGFLEPASEPQTDNLQGFFQRMIRLFR